MCCFNNSKANCFLKEAPRSASGQRKRPSHFVPLIRFVAVRTGRCCRTTSLLRHHYRVRLKESLTCQGLFGLITLPKHYFGGKTVWKNLSVQRKMFVMNLCTLPRKFNWQEVDIAKKERVPVHCSTVWKRRLRSQGHHLHYPKPWNTDYIDWDKNFSAPNPIPSKTSDLYCLWEKNWWTKPYP